MSKSMGREIVEQVIIRVIAGMITTAVLSHMSWGKMKSIKNIIVRKEA